MFQYLFSFWLTAENQFSKEILPFGSSCSFLSKCVCRLFEEGFVTVMCDNQY